MSEDHTRTVSNAHYMEIVAKAMFMDSIMALLDVSKPQDALQRVEEIQSKYEDAFKAGQKAQIEHIKRLRNAVFLISGVDCPTCR